MRGSLRAHVGKARRSAWDAAALVDPSRLGLDPGARPTQTGLICVYRSRNAHVVRDLIKQLPGCSVRLWSLDGAVPADLEPVTFGTGPGTRLALLNRLVAGLPPGQRGGGLVLVDDDVRFVVGDLAMLVDAGHRTGLDVFQPAHLARSNSSWPFTRRRALLFSREVDYVEQGPVVVLSAAAQQVLLPLPEDLDMGWGVEVRWWQAARSAGLRLGVVDAVGILHLAPVGGAYDRSAQEAVLAQEVRIAGLRDITDLHRARRRVWAPQAWLRRPRVPRDGGIRG